MRTIMLVLLLVPALGVVGGLDTMSTPLFPFRKVTYSSARVDLSYQSDDKFDPKGMEHLYTVTNLFLDLIEPNQVDVPDGIIIKHDWGISIEVQELYRHWDTLVVNHIGIIVCAVIGVLFAVMMPIIGFIFCCCRCANRCGAQSQDYDKKTDPCKRVCLGMIMGLFVIIILFGVVCAFVTNEYMQHGVNKLPRQMEAGLADTSLYLNNTKKEVNNLLVNNFDELEDSLYYALDKSGSIVKGRLAEVSRAVAVDNLTHIVSGLDRIQRDLREIVDYTDRLHTLSRQLEGGLQGVRLRLQTLLQQCQSTSCRSFVEKYNLDDLDVQANFRKLPDVTTLSNEISILIQNNIKGEVQRGKQAFDSLDRQVQRQVDRIIPNVKAGIQRVGIDLREASANITSLIDKFSVRRGHQAIIQLDDLSKEYAIYRYYIGVGMAGLVLLIMLCFVIGLCYGFCGKRPGYAEDCCNKGSGAAWLLCGVYLVFIFSFLLMLLTTAHFVIGGIADKVICDSMNDPDNSQLVEELEYYVHLQQYYPRNVRVPVSLPMIIDNCHRNQSLYEVLKLESYTNISVVKNYRYEYNVEREITELRNRINVDPRVTILTKRAKEQLQQLANSRVSDINFTAYAELLKQEITSIDLVHLAAALNSTAEKLQTEDNIANQLRNEALFVEGQQRLVSNMAGIIHELQEVTKNLQSDMKFNKSSLRLAVKELLQQVERAQDYLDHQGPKEMVALADNFTRSFMRQIDTYTDRVDYQVRREIGKCWPMSRVYNATVVGVCNNVIFPFNGFWASIGWCLVLFLPCIILSVVLSALYRIQECYPGSVLDHESPYDAYSDRDNIPLANTAFRGVGDGRGNQDMPPPPPDASSDLRDRNWDYPNGGPPEYSSNPNLHAEYERPPPYYFPGPGEAKS